MPNIRNHIIVTFHRSIKVLIRQKKYKSYRSIPNSRICRTIEGLKGIFHLAMYQCLRVLLHLKVIGEIPITLQPKFQVRLRHRHRFLRLHILLSRRNQADREPYRRPTPHNG